MDPVSQGLLGAVLPQSAAKKEEVRAAAVTGLLSAQIADADIFIRSSSDPMLWVEFHRHFTHALIMVPMGGLLGAAILWPFLRKRLAFSRILLFSTLGLATAGLLDACTSYGTRLFWPFSEQRVAWDVISIIDPVFTLILLAAVVIAVKKRSRAVARAGLVLAVAYLALGAVQRERAEAVMQDLAAGRGHAVERGRVMPTIGNLVLWRAIYEAKGRIHADGVRPGIFGDTVRYPGGSVEKFHPGLLDPPPDPGSVLRDDIRRFNQFADRYTALHPDDPAVLADFRYALLPDSLEPLWGIKMDPSHPDRHVEFVRFRRVTRQAWETFLAMLLGKVRNQN